MRKILLCLSVFLSVQCFAKHSGPCFSLNEFEKKLGKGWEFKSLNSTRVIEGSLPIERINVVYKNVDNDKILLVQIVRFHADAFEKFKEFEEENRFRWVNLFVDVGYDFAHERQRQLELKASWLSAFNGVPISFDNDVYALEFSKPTFGTVNALAKFSVNDYALIIYQMLCPTTSKTKMIQDEYLAFKSL